MNHIINCEEMEILDNKGKGLQKRVQKWVQSFEVGGMRCHTSATPRVLNRFLSKR